MCLYADDAELLAFNEFNKVVEQCMREKNMKTRKSKVMGFKRSKYDVRVIGDAYSVKKPNDLDCRITLSKDVVENVVREFN